MYKLAGDLRHLDLMEMEKQYGKVFRLYLGSQLVVVVSGENALKEVLVTKSIEFAGRPSQHTTHIFSKGRAIILADYSSDCRLRRKAASSAPKTYSDAKLIYI